LSGLGARESLREEQRNAWTKKQVKPAAMSKGVTADARLS